jgi:hypothetical protein
MKDTDRAFPSLMSFVNNDGVQRIESGVSGMTLKQYAAIHLKVPRSGDPEIDGMIRESVRKDFVTEAMKVLFSEHSSIDDKETVASLADSCFVFANAVLVEWEKGIWK